MFCVPVRDKNDPHSRAMWLRYRCRVYYLSAVCFVYRYVIEMTRIERASVSTGVITLIFIIISASVYFSFRVQKSFGFRVSSQGLGFGCRVQDVGSRV